ncbi:MAG: hypothetical protein ABSH50_12255 [Bryobacteraceae bacterium]|jgi:legume-like lectin family protein
MHKTIRSLVCSPVVFVSLCAAATPGRVPLSSLQLNGSATFLQSEGAIELTSTTGQESAAFIPTAFTLGPTGEFVATFEYEARSVHDVCVGDGLAFVAQNTSAGASYLGLGGSGLGFFTLTDAPAIGITFDYYSNAYTGTPPNTAGIAVPIGMDLSWTTPDPPPYQPVPSPSRYVWVIYKNATSLMRVYYSATPTMPSTPLLERVLPQDLSTAFGGQAYFGLTGGTGSCAAVQIINYLGLDISNAP